MKKILTALCIAMILSGCSARASKPRGKLIYCSYAADAVASLGKDYCELIADPGAEPRIVVVKNENCHFMEASRAEYTATAEEVTTLQEMLENAKVYKLNGYHLEEAICGGTAYRIYMEYDSGDTVNARWYGHKVKDEALSAYALIERWFRPWYEMLVTE